MRKKLLDYVVYLAVRWLICIIQMLSPEACQGLARGFAWLAFDGLGIRRRLTMENLKHAFPEKTEEERLAIARSMWRNLIMLVCEVALVSRKIHETNWRDYVSYVNAELLIESILDDRPVMAVSAHFGNFEVSGYMMGLFGFPMHAVARALDNPYLHDLVNESRRRTGQQIIPKSAGFEWVEEVLLDGDTLALLADQHAGRRGCEATFFGRTVSAHKAIAVLALKHEVPLVVGYTRRREGPLQFEMVIQSRLDPREQPPELATVQAATQWYTSELERFIRTQPDQYWWLHNRWRGVPPRGKKQKRAAAQEPSPAKAA